MLLPREVLAPQQQENSEQKLIASNLTDTADTGKIPFRPTPLSPRMRRNRSCLLALLLLPAAISQVAHAQTTATFSYDSLQRVTGAAKSDGSNLQYQYDANGNLISLIRTNPAALPPGQAIDVNLDAPGQLSTPDVNPTDSGGSKVDTA